jgi:hypothetical protein
MMDVVDYAERISSPGFVFMNTPGYDPASLTGLAAGGEQDLGAMGDLFQPPHHDDRRRADRHRGGHDPD